VSPRFSLDDAHELLHLDIGESEADTIGGLIYERLGEIPKAGDALQLGPATVTVVSVRGHRIMSVRIESPEPLVKPRTHDGDHQEAPEERRAAHA
jgi:CBS domain containing-hemolysin-like protein